VFSGQSRPSSFDIRHFLNIRSIGGIRGCLLPYELVSWSATAAREQRRQALNCFRELRPTVSGEGAKRWNAKKVQKISIDLICEQ
jgi:hypothetical protein